MSQRLRPKPVAGIRRPSDTGAIAGRSGPGRRPSFRSLDSWWPALICGLLVLAVWIVFGQTRHFEFINFDDPQYVSENPAVTQGLTLKGIVWAFTHFNGGEWWPLTSISHMLDCELYGLNPGGHHLTNVVLHAATAVLLFLLLRKMTGALWSSAFVAAVFAIHPLRVESVAWVTERKDVLSGLFFVLTLLAYARYVQRSETRSVRSGGQGAPAYLRPLASLDYWLALFSFTLSLMAKSMVVTLPFVLLLLDYWPLRRLTPGADFLPTDPRGVRRLLIEKIPFLLLAVASGLITILAIEDIKSGEALSLPWRVGNAVVAYAAYLSQMIYPVGLAVLYPHPLNQLPVWQVGVSAMVCLVITVAVLAGQRKRPYLLVGWLWYVGMLVPVIGLLQVGSQARADRYTYLPQIGLYVLVIWGAVDLCRNWRHGRLVLRAVAVLVLAALMVVAHGQTRYWRDSVSLWTHTLTNTTRNFSAHYDLGMALAARGRRNEAIEQYRLALKLRPESAKAHNNLGIELAGEGRLTEAIQQWKRALQLQPDHAEVNNNLANALAAQRKWPEAIDKYKRSLELEPNDAKVHYNLGIALAADGKLDEAAQQYRRAFELKSDFAQAQNNLGVVLAAQTKWDEAIQHYERALQLKPDYTEAEYNLGIALAAQGRLNDAIEHQQQALNLATAQNNTALAQQIRQRLESYQQKLPLPHAP